MNKKKIAIVTTAFYPNIGAGNKRIANIIRYLLNDNYSVYLFTLGLANVKENNSVPLLEFGDIFNNKKLKIYRYSPITQGITSKISLARKILNFLKIKLCWDYYLDWAIYALPHIFKVIKREKIKIVLSSSPSYSSIFLCNAIKKKTGNVKWIMDIRDPWLESIYHRYNNFQKAFIKKIEETAFGNADSITVVSKYMKELYGQKYNEDKIKIIYNGFNKNKNFTFKSFPDYINNSSFSLLYTGFLYKERKDIFLKFLRIIKELKNENIIEEKEIRVYLAGPLNDGDRESLKNLLPKSFNYIGNLQLEESIYLQKKSDLLLLITADINAFPSKLFEYINSGKTILYLANNVNSEIKNIILSTGTGASFNINESERIKEFIMACYLGKIKFNVDKKVINRFSFENSAKSMIKIFDRFISECDK